MPLRFALALAALGIATSCLAQEAPATAADVQLVDARPTDESVTKGLSVWLWSCDYGVARIGDRKGVDDRVAKLKEALQASLGAKLQGHAVTLDHYALYLNGGAAATGEAWTTGVATVVRSGATWSGNTGPHASTKCSREKSHAGWFQPEETTNANPPFVSEVALHVDGKPIELRSVLSPDHAPAFVLLMNGGIGRPLTDDANLAIAKTNQAIVAAVAKALPQAPA